MIELEHVICTTIISKQSYEVTYRFTILHAFAQIIPRINSTPCRSTFTKRIFNEKLSHSQKRDDVSLKIPSYLIIIRSNVGRATLSVMFERRFHTKRGISVTINLACINRESKNIRSPSRIFFITLHIYVTFTILPFFYFIFLALNSFSLFH